MLRLSEYRTVGSRLGASLVGGCEFTALLLVGQSTALGRIT